MRKLDHYNTVTPVIVSYADANHYVIMLRDGKEEALACDSHGRGLSFDGLVQAKDALKREGYALAKMRFESAYDEMSGTIATQPDEVSLPL